MAAPEVYDLSDAEWQVIPCRQPPPPPAPPVPPPFDASISPLPPSAVPQPHPPEDFVENRRKSWLWESLSRSASPSVGLCCLAGAGAGAAYWWYSSKSRDNSFTATGTRPLVGDVQQTVTQSLTTDVQKMPSFEGAFALHENNQAAEKQPNMCEEAEAGIYSSARFRHREATKDGLFAKRAPSGGAGRDGSKRKLVPAEEVAPCSQEGPASHKVEPMSDLVDEMAGSQGAVAAFVGALAIAGLGTAFARRTPRAFFRSIQRVVVTDSGTAALLHTQRIGPQQPWRLPQSGSSWPWIFQRLPVAPIPKYFRPGLDTGHRPETRNVLPALSANISTAQFYSLDPCCPERIVEHFDPGCHVILQELSRFLCHQLKVGQEWLPIVEALALHPAFAGTNLTETDLFLWLLSNADSDVRRQVVGLWSQYNAVPLQLPTSEEAFCQELFWSMPEQPVIINFKLASDPIGISAFANKVFGTNFEQSGSRFGSWAQIHFDVGFKQPGRGFAVADVHGPINMTLQSRVLKFFPVFVLHVPATSLAEPIVHDCLRSLSAMPRTRHAFVASWGDRGPRYEASASSLQRIGGNVSVHQIRGNQKRDVDEFRKAIVSQLKPMAASLSTPTESPTSSALDWAASGDSGMSPFLKTDILSLTGQTVPRSIRLAQDLANKSHLTLPMHAKYQELCRSERLLKSADHHDDRHAMQKHNLNRHAAVNDMRAVRPSPDIEQFMEIIQDPQYAQVALADLNKHMSSTIDAAARLDLKQHQRYVQLHREVAQLLSRSDVIDGTLKEGVLQAYARLFSQGLPFELLDGEQLHVPSIFLEEVFRRLPLEMQRKPLVVVSTIGPQSSGKSTLNNRRFGSSFWVSEGRCTRGIYGQFLNTKEATLLVLDTEGLQSVEKSDPQFDRLMTLFVLAMSDFIDINVKGMINEPLKRQLEICIRALQQLEMAKVSCPTVNLVMNQVADPNPEHHMQGFKQIQEELKELFAEQPALLDGLLTLDPSRLKVVPNMFLENVLPTFSKEHPNWVQLKLSRSFGETCHALTATLCDDLSGTVQRLERPFDRPTNWLTLAASVFDTITRYPDLTYFADIRQVRLEGHLRQWISDRMDAAFHGEGGFAIGQHLREVVDQEGQASEAKIRFSSCFVPIEQDLEEAFATQMSKLKCDAFLKDRMRRVLQGQLEVEKSRWMLDLERSFGERAMQRACSRGAEALNAEIIRLQRNPDDIPAGQALEAHFDYLWYGTISELRNKFKEEEFNHRLLLSIHRCYPIEGRRLPAFENVLPFSKGVDPWQVFETPETSWLIASRGAPHIEDAFVEALFVNKQELESHSQNRNTPGNASEITATDEKSLHSVPSGPGGNDWLAVVLNFVEWRHIFVALQAQIDRVLKNRGGITSGNGVMFQVASCANDVEKQLNEELGRFGVQLSREGRGRLDLLAVLLAWHGNKKAAWDRFMTPILRFEQERPKQWEYFKTSIMQDAQADASHASRFVEQLRERLLSSTVEMCESQCQALIARARPHVTREEVQRQCDALLGSEHPDSQEPQLEYVLDPTKSLLIEFERRWSSRVEKDSGVILRDALDLYRLRLREANMAMCKVEGVVNGFQSSRSVDLFVVGPETGSPRMTQLYSKRAAVQFLRDSLTEEGPMPLEWSFDGVTVRACELPSVGFPVRDPGLLRELRDEKLWDTMSIENLCTFMNGAKHLQDDDTAAGSMLEGAVTALLNEAKQEALLKLLPCSKRCPCCGRLCDNPDTSGSHVHRCFHGHQIRGFNGTYLDDGERTASTKVCTQLKDEDEYVDNRGLRMTWSDFKELNMDWDFSDHQSSERYEFEARTLRSWHQIGPEVCKRFGIRYTPLGEQGSLKATPLHFLLILDQSGSMRGSPWITLMEAVRELIRLRQAGGHETDRFSVILFDRDASTAFSFEESESALRRVRGLRHGGGDTCFDAALLEGKRLLRDEEASRFGHHRHVIVFMSDGHCNFSPDIPHGIQAEFGHIISRSYCIGFGEGTEILEDVAECLAGHYISAPGEMDLLKTFAEIAQQDADR